MEPEEGAEHRVRRPRDRIHRGPFHPRRQDWHDHFALRADGTIAGRTPEGRTTVELLDMNDERRVQIRALLLLRGHRP
jgi:hypothetical protein